MARRSYQGGDSLSEWYYRGYNKAYYENYHNGYNEGYASVYDNAYTDGEALARTEGGKGADKSFESMDTLNKKGTKNPYNILRFTARANNSTVGYTNYGGNTPLIYWSKNGGEWAGYASGSSFTLNVGEYVDVYGDNIDGFSKSFSMYTKFNITGAVECSGKVSALISGWIDTFEIPNDYCFLRLFYNCTGLLTAPELSATTLADYCYYYMFHTCKSLKTAPELPATTLAFSCYNCMFQGCTSLTTAPELPATTLENGCYNGMFYGCSNLTTAPELPATTLVSSCYISMFQGCTSLTTAPELPATTLVSNCYRSMFYGCTSLTTAPELPATTLVSNCYYQMFYNCKKLQLVTTYATTWNTSNQNNWLNGAGTEAFNPTVFCPANSNIETGNSSGIPTGWKRSEIGADTVVPEEYLEDYNMGISDGSSVGISDGETQGISSGTSMGRMNGYYNNIKLSFYENLVRYYGDLSVSVNTTGIVRKLAFTAPSTGSELNIVNYGYNDVLLFYSFDGTTWSRVVFSGEAQDDAVTITNNDSTTTYLMGFNIGSFNKSLSKYIKITTNQQTTITSSGNTGDINALKLGINIGGYIRAAKSYDFYNIFKNNTTLFNAPELPATTLVSNCYRSMFQGCTSLTTAPELPATTLVSSCYSYMFQGCTSLTTAPELPATTLVSNCYSYMFQGCTSLTTAPELPATTLVSNCYSYMFQGCTSLSCIKVHATTWNTSYASNWVSGVRNIKGSEFHKPSVLKIGEGTGQIPQGSANGIPTGWDVFPLDS